jgi:hypothetical protein
VRYLRDIIFVLSLSALVILAEAQEVPDSTQAEGVGWQSSPHTAPAGKGPGMGRRYQQIAPGPGRGSPIYRSDPGAARPAAVPKGSVSPASPSQLGGPGQRRPPALGFPPSSSDVPVYGPPPGFGRSYRGHRPRGGPGYPGLRGPGTGYPRHRQYANPPRYPTRTPEQNDLGGAGPDAEGLSPELPSRAKGP